jgi:predicted TPR repeat methyltransferase
LNRPGLYNETKVGDIIEIFRELKPVSLIVAGDSYIYFGDLNPLLESVSDSLVGGGYAAFTLEDVDAVSATSLNITKPGWRWMLTPSGRFAHNKEYVKTLGGKHSLHTMYYEHLDGFRYENGVPVRGHIFVMKKMVEQEL